MEEQILNTFYEEIIPNASKTGIILIDGIKYHIHFNTQIHDQEIHITNNTIPLLTINNVNNFNDKLIEYLEKSMMFFADSKFDSVKERVCGFKKDDQIKYLLTILFANCTEEDFRNPIQYLQRQIDFIDNNSLYEKYGMYTEVANIPEFDNSSIEVLSTSQEPTLETPYVFSSRIKKYNSNQYYDLPNISYGISNDTVYIYTIKGKRRKTNEKPTTFTKKINRELYKINKNVIPTTEYVNYKEGKTHFYPENVIDVTHSSVLALTIFLGILKKENYNRVVVVDYLPLRYLSKYETKLSTLGKNHLYGDMDYDKAIINIDEELDYNQNNITNKFIRTFERVNYHLENMNIISYPGEIDNCMHIKINDNMNHNSNHVINYVYDKIVDANKKESRK